jgi:hypothetical protein
LVLGVRGKRAFAIGGSFLLWALSGAHCAGGRIDLVAPVWGQTEADLAAARRLFAEALADEHAGRQGAALEKFQRVQAVRDTQAVRYRIATCLEALGQLRAALAAYTNTSIAAATDPESTQIARASRDKVDALSKRVARLVVTLPSSAPLDAVVKIDGEIVQPNALGTPVVVDPGPHEITATGGGATPFHAQLTLSEGAQGTLEATLVVPPPPEPPKAAAAPETPRPRGPEPPLPASAASSSARRTTGLVLVTAGGVLLAAATALLLVRNSDIESLNAACAGGTCPLDRQSELESTRNRALIEGPTGIGVGAAGVIAAGVGIYLLATHGSPARAAIAPWASQTAGGMACDVRF